MQLPDRRHGRAGFTMIELMIAVVIVGILASAAIPSYRRYHLRAEAGEARANLGGIRTASESYFAENGGYLAAVPAPATVPGIAPQAWPGSVGFDAIGWRPAGLVRFQYAVTVSGSAQSFTAEAQGDLDGDTVPSLFGFVKANGSNGPVAGALGCPASGVLVNGASVHNMVGGCTATSGTSAF